MKIGKKGTTFAFFLALCLPLWRPGALAAAQARTEKPTVKIGYASQSGAFAQMWIAAQKGYFAAEGLNAEIIFSRSVTGVQALIAGEVDFVGTGCPEFFQAKRSGFDLKVVADAAPVNVYLIASRYMKLPTTDARLAASYGFFAKDAYFAVPKVTLESARTTLDMMAETDPSWKEERAESYVDTSIMSRLEAESFTDAVHKEFFSK